MDDKQRSLSPKTVVYSELQQILSRDECNQLFPLINSATGSNVIDDEVLALQEQDRLFYESYMDVDTAPPQAASLHPNLIQAIDADAEFALKLQQEEYSRGSIVPPRRPNSSSRQSNNDTFAPLFDETYNQPILSDAELAAHLQAEENQKRRSSYTQRRPPRQPVQRPFQFDDPEVIPMPSFATHIPSDPSSNGYNNGGPDDFPNFLRRFVPRGRAAPALRRAGGSRRGRSLQNVAEDFGPEHYEALLGLDDANEKKKLTKEQINTLPTVQFHRSANPKDNEENQCSICMDQFEENQLIRRLKCLHFYHKQCVDRWLQTNNLCPICRLPAV